MSRMLGLNKQHRLGTLETSSSGVCLGSIRYIEVESSLEMTAGNFTPRGDLHLANSRFHFFQDPIHSES